MTSLHGEANSRALQGETVRFLAQLVFTYYSLGALIRHVVNILMVYSDGVFTVLIQSNRPRLILL